MYRGAFGTKMLTIIATVAVGMFGAAGTQGAWVDVSASGVGPWKTDAAAPSPDITVLWHNSRGLELSVHVPGVVVEPEQTTGGEFTAIRLPGMPLDGTPGAPAWPVVRDLFIAPVGATVEIAVETGPAVLIDLADAGFERPALPALRPPTPDRHSLSGSPDEDPLPPVPAEYRVDASAYSLDLAYPAQRASIEAHGELRGYQLYALNVNPISYNPASGTVQAWPDLRVRLSFSGGAPSQHPLLPGTEKLILNAPQTTGSRAGANDYLIIAAPDFVDSAPLNQFIAAKTNQGYHVMVYEPPVGTGQTVVLDYIEAVWATTNAPDYLLIVGDALDEATTVGAYSIPIWIRGILYNWRTDLPYACMGGSTDWVADIAMGRWPVRTVAQLQSVVDKTLYVEGNVYADPSFAERAMFVAHPDPEADAAGLHDFMVSTYMDPAGIDSTKIYYDDGGTTQDIADAFNGGIFLGVYYGHTSSFQWNSPAFTIPDVNALTNQNLYPFVISFGCNINQFALADYDPSFHEHILRVEDKGAAACFGPIRGDYYGWEPWALTYEYLMDNLYAQDIRELGPAYQAAVARMVAYYGPEQDVSQDMSYIYHLLGDPSLALPEPPAEQYLILTAEDFNEPGSPLETFVQHKKNLGYDVSVYEVAPGTTNAQLKSYIQSLWGTAAAPDYLLIVGDATDNQFSATSSTIPYWVGGGDKDAATDWPYACMDAGDDWYPEFPVGRFSVQDTDDLQAVIDKTMTVELGNFTNPDYVARGTFIANYNTQGQAEVAHDYVIDNYLTPNDYVGNRIYSNEGGTSQDVRDAVNAGSLWTVYFGHSGSSGWWDPSFDQGDVQGLLNDKLYGVAMGWSCNTAHYTYSECFGETWIREANKGSAAYISASDYIYWGSVDAWAPSVALEKAIFASFLEDEIWTLGPAWVNALYRFLTEFGGWDGDPSHGPTQNADMVRNFFEEFVILGDPGLQLPRPNGFSLSVNPEALSLCAPADGAYNLNLEVVGSFDEVVHLAVSGVPAGASASFTANDQVPPFTSTLQITNTGGATPGSYDLQIDATAPSLLRSTTVELTISDAIPGTPTLLSPANGTNNAARTPTLSWQAASQAAEYDVEVATDASFSNIVYSTTVEETSHTVADMLDSGATYFWRVEATNGCGSGGVSTTFEFTTITQADYFTEEFPGAGDAFDLDGYTLFLSPNGSGSFYEACIEPAPSLPTDPAGGTTLSLSDDGSASVSPGATVYLYGQSYSSFYVNSNGNISFNSSDGTVYESISQHFSLPRISGLFDDLNPASSGYVNWKVTAECVAVTWNQVPEWNAGTTNTFQIEMFFDGDIHITWLGIASSDSVVGISAGNGIPADWLEYDLSGAGACVGPPVGACCQGLKCLLETEDDCLGLGGTYQGDGTSCDPDPCAEYHPECLIISEVVQGTESGDCPCWMEITNTGTEDFVFFEGGLIVQTGSSTDTVIDVDLAGTVIAAGDSFVINSNVSGVCTGAFDATYPVSADLYTNVAFGAGNDRLILTDTDDSSHIIDIYGQFGIDGTGTTWEYTRGYSYRVADWCAGTGDTFVSCGWFFGGVDSLEGGGKVMLALTDPGIHKFNASCTMTGDIDVDSDVDMDDYDQFNACFGGPDTGGPAGCYPLEFDRSDLDGDGDVDLVDFAGFMMSFIGQ